MNRRGFFAVLFAPLAISEGSKMPFRPVNWGDRVDLEEMHDGQWIVVDGQARRINGYNEFQQVVFANPEDVDDWWVADE